MRLIKLIVPAAMIAVLALFASHADAQTMGEYATTVGVASGGATSMGTSIGSSVSNSTDDLGGGSRTWGASSLGGSFDERAGAASGSGLGQDFEARAGASSSGSGSESRWPASPFGNGESSNRFGDSSGSSSGRWPESDRFKEQSQLSSSSDRFPPGVLDQNRQGLDTHYSSSSELDNHYSTSGELDNSYSSN
ncbi:MAG TPA: hypothetical protein VJX68_17185 [Candidatus Binatus sp.]|uniref:hypothetical protein n=1 Tax=Candidatus Binatus sp. TaxID=2811406 RepID=UPI002B46ABD0|nr:hypothetical protein [Candidatus Binatus sp.]HKN14925.1 hypothetical protein [Candidatus Binatus sp.]